MKKILCILLTLFVVASLAACTLDGGAKNTEAADTTPATVATTAAETVASTTAEATPEGYAVGFVTDEFVSVTVYLTQDMSETGPVTEEAVSRESESGTPTKTDGQINFVLTFAEGYELDDIQIEGEYNKLKGAGDTGVENGYRITKIAGNLTVTVTSRSEGTAEDDSANGYAVTFVCDEFVSVTIYPTQDLSSGGAVTDTAASRDGATGAATKEDGQVNFVLSFAEGYELGEIQIAEADNYNKLKSLADDGAENGYRITKIKGDLTVTVTAVAKQ